MGQPQENFPYEVCKMLLCLRKFAPINKTEKKAFFKKTGFCPSNFAQ